MNIDPLVSDVLVWTGLGLMGYMLTSAYSLLRYSLYRDRTKHPRDWPRLNRYFEYYNAIPAGWTLWILVVVYDRIEQGVRKIRHHNSILSV